MVVQIADPQDQTKNTAFLVYDIRDIPIAQKWAERVSIAQKNGLTVSEGGWWLGFPGLGRNMQSLSNDINERVDVINQYYPKSIPERAYPEMDQDRLNLLHHYFELYRGPVDASRFMWVEGDDILRAALEELNVGWSRLVKMLR